MTCPHCGKKIEPKPQGRPRRVDDKRIVRLRKAGKSLREIAVDQGVAVGSIQFALRRTGKAK